jgi:hypothetical protein
VQAINNLAYANGSMPLVGGGIQVGGAVGSNSAVVEFNTCYANGVNGILIGTGQGPSTQAKVFYNIVSSNGQNGVQLGDNTTYQVDLPGYSEGYNLAFGNNYGAGLQRPTNDLLGFDPEFVDPAGPDGILGGAGFADDDFHLSQIAAGQMATSPAVRFADIDPTMAPIMGRTTRTDGVPDADNADIGFHYPAGSQYSPPTPSPAGPLAGDCNGDGRVTVAEVITAVNIALGTESLSACPAADLDGDGQVSISELVQAVANVLR